ncbi:hypothetical protein BDFB_009103 [Asbolus verrucosus]|uniref:CRAL TRIO domain containing protein n=1 Tax=Asbolus verrucosus TaxID=1661398 RepID=A0A482W8J4_ASBVE|nr:hypothetical protein BDFB_009103 [Asbolus verrucosus]
MYIHHDFQSLHEFVPKSILPEEYGGTTGKMDIFQSNQNDLHRELWLKELEEYTSWFKEQENIKSDESKTYQL